MWKASPSTRTRMASFRPHRAEAAAGQGQPASLWDRRRTNEPETRAHIGGRSGQRTRTRARTRPPRFSPRAVDPEAGSTASARRLSVHAIRWGPFRCARLTETPPPLQPLRTIIITAGKRLERAGVDAHSWRISSRGARLNTLRRVIGGRDTLFFWEEEDGAGDRVVVRKHGWGVGRGLGAATAKSTPLVATFEVAEVTSPAGLVMVQVWITTPTGHLSSRVALLA